MAVTLCGIFRGWERGSAGGIVVGEGRVTAFDGRRIGVSVFAEAAAGAGRFGGERVRGDGASSLSDLLLGGGVGGVLRNC